MEFYAGERVVVNPLRVKSWILSELETSLVLFYTDTSRASATIIDEQIRNVKGQDSASVETMHKLKQDAVLMKEAVLKGNFKALSAVMERSWLAKKRTARSITSERIEMTYEAAKASGALAGKVSG